MPGMEIAKMAKTQCAGADILVEDKTCVRLIISQHGKCCRGKKCCGSNKSQVAK